MPLASLPMKLGWKSTSGTRKRSLPRVMMLPSLLSVLEVLDAAIVLADKIRFSIGVHKAARSEVRSFFFRHTVEAHAEIDVEHLQCTSAILLLVLELWSSKFGFCLGAPDFKAGDLVARLYACALAVVGSQ